MKAYEEKSAVPFDYDFVTLPPKVIEEIKNEIQLSDPNKYIQSALASYADRNNLIDMFPKINQAIKDVTFEKQKTEKENGTSFVNIDKKFESVQEIEQKTRQKKAFLKEIIKLKVVNA